MGTRAAVVYASGYTEEHSEEGNALDAELQSIAAKYNMDIMGPNCMGALNNVDGINLMGLGVPEGHMERDHKVAIVSHSGSLSSGLVRRGNFPLAYQLSVGNGTITAMEDYVEFFAEDDSVKVIALYMEGLKKPDVFLRGFHSYGDGAGLVLRAGTESVDRRAAQRRGGGLCCLPHGQPGRFVPVL